MSKDKSANDSETMARGNGTDSVSGLLDGYPDAAVIVLGDVTVIAANEKGKVLKALLDHGEISEIPEMITEAEANKRVVVGSVMLSGSKGDIFLDISVIPITAGGVGTDAQYMVLSHDVTMERNLRSALVESRQRYKDLVEVSSDFSWEVGHDGTFSFVSPAGVLGFTPEQLVGQRPQDFVLNAEDYNPLLFLSDRNERNVEIWMRTSQGKNACVVGSSRPLTGADGQWLGARGICRDVTIDRDREAALRSAREREQLLNRIVKSIRDEVNPLNMLNKAAATTSQALGAAGCRIYRHHDEDGFVLAAEYGQLGVPDEEKRFLEKLGAEGTTISVDAGPWRVLVTPTNYRQKINGAICIWKPLDDSQWDSNYFILLGDVANQIGVANEQSANHERIVNLSRTDGMTGLLNRRAFFEDELPRRFTRLEKDGQGAALFYLDMDNFKLVNDVHGHQRGDDAIICLRELMLKHSRPGDALVRLGGDEFAMWLDGMVPDVAIERVELILQDSISLREFSGDENRPLGVSIGVAMYDPANGESLESLVARADTAMYEVKNDGKGGYRVAPPPGDTAGSSQPENGNA